MKTRIERILKTRSVVIEDGTVGCCDYPVIGETKTIWFRGEDGIPVQKTGIVIKILKD